MQTAEHTGRTQTGTRLRPIPSHTTQRTSQQAEHTRRQCGQTGTCASDGAPARTRQAQTRAPDSSITLTNTVTDKWMNSRADGSTTTLYAVWKDLRIRYAVMAYGIGVDKDASGNTMGITFGPALGYPEFSKYDDSDKPDATPQPRHMRTLPRQPLPTRTSSTTRENEQSKSASTRSGTTDSRTTRARMGTPTMPICST